jgi:uncharacterized protein YciI
LFIIDLHYLVTLDELEEHMADHVRYLRKYYRKKIFIASGRKVPRTGGIILAVGDSAELIQSIIQEDPFYVHKIAQFTITEFITSQYHPDMEPFVDKLH